MEGPLYHSLGAAKRPERAASQGFTVDFEMFKISALLHKWWHEKGAALQGKTIFMQELGNTLARAAKSFIFYEQYTDKVVTNEPFLESSMSMLMLADV